MRHPNEPLDALQAAVLEGLVTRACELTTTLAECHSDLAGAKAKAAAGGESDVSTVAASTSASVSASVTASVSANMCVEGKGEDVSAADEVTGTGTGTGKGEGGVGVEGGESRRAAAKDRLRRMVFESGLGLGDSTNDALAHSVAALTGALAETEERLYCVVKLLTTLTLSTPVQHDQSAGGGGAAAEQGGGDGEDDGDDDDGDGGGEYKSEEDNTLGRVGTSASSSSSSVALATDISASGGGGGGGGGGASNSRQWGTKTERFLGRPETCRMLFTLLLDGSSPRLRRMACRLIARILRRVGPRHVASSGMLPLGLRRRGPGGLVDRLLLWLGELVASPAEAAFGKGAGVGAGTAGGNRGGIVDRATSGSGGTGVGMVGETLVAFRGELVGLLRCLLSSKPWHDLLVASIERSIQGVPALIAKARNGSHTPRSTSQCLDPSTDAVRRALAVLCVIGGNVESLRVGGRVARESASGSSSEAGTMVRRHERYGRHD